MNQKLKNFTVKTNAFFMGTLFATASFAQTLPEVKLNYVSVIESLQRETNFPLRLPSFLLGYDLLNEQEVQNQQFYPHLESVDANSYTMNLGLVENCNGATACNSVTLKAQKINPTTVSLNSLAQEIEENLTTPRFGQFETRSIGLGTNKEVKAILVPSICFASCTQTKVIFDKQGVRYMVGEKAGNPETVIKMANSMIINPIKF